jgi:hypothetical protein
MFPQLIICKCWRKARHEHSCVLHDCVS